MKLAILMTFLVFTIYSCVSIYFTEPQPKDGFLFEKIPEELHGQWDDKSSGGIKIVNNGIITFKIRKDSLSNITDTSFTNFILSDTVQLYKLDPFYILNYKTKNNPWEIAIIEKQKNGNILTYVVFDPELFTKDTNLKLENANFTINGEDTIVKTLNPYCEHSIKLNNATFSGKMSVQTIKKLAKRKNIFYILKKDGFVYPQKSRRK